MGAKVVDVERRLTKALVADKPTEQVEEREPGGKLKEGAEAKNRQIKRNLKLSLRGSVERRAQHEPDRLKKPTIESAKESRLNKRRVGLTDRSNKVVRVEHSTRKIMFIYCQSSFMSINVVILLVSTQCQGLYISAL